MLKLAAEKGELTVVTDEVVGPTYTPDVAAQLVRLVDTSSYGIIHATGGGAVSWHGFAEETLRLAGLESVPVHPASAATMVRTFRRPAQSILAHGRLMALGIDVMRSMAGSAAGLPTGGLPAIRRQRRSPDRARHHRPVIGGEPADGPVGQIIRNSSTDRGWRGLCNRKSGDPRRCDWAPGCRRDKEQWCAVGCLARFGKRGTAGRDLVVLQGRDRPRSP